jgi:tRNA(Leu) C34 or U34 (ribose-2'-O)-methylase TrmL
MKILDDLESLMSQKFEHCDDLEAYRENKNVKMFATTIEQHKSQHHVQFGAYGKFMVKKFCTPNPNEAIDEFNYAPSRPEKQRMNLSYAAAVITPVQGSEYSKSETDNI